MVSKKDSKKKGTGEARLRSARRYASAFIAVVLASIKDIPYNVVKESVGD